MVHGRPIKCSWGKDRADGAVASTPISPTAAPASPYGNMVSLILCSRFLSSAHECVQPMYGMPQPNTYGQYGFAGYGGFPNQAAGAGAGAPGATGMPQPAAAAAGLGLAGAGQQPGADPNAAAGQAGQAQWAGADPSSYYSNYWGGT